MKKIIVVAALFLAPCSAGAQSTANQQTGETPLSAKTPFVVRRDLQLQGSLPTMFATLVKEANLSGGVATSNEGCSQGSEGTISVSAGAKFDKAVAQFVKLRSASRWQVQDGVANLFSAGAVPPLLQVQIRSFAWDSATPVREVIDRLRRLPEVSEEASKLGLQEAPFEGGSSTICIRGDCREKQKIETMLETEEGVSLLTVLNRVVQAHNGAVWNYSDYHCDNGALFSLGVSAE